MTQMNDIIAASGVVIDKSHCPQSGHLPTWHVLRKSPAKYDKEDSNRTSVAEPDKKIEIEESK